MKPITFQQIRTTVSGRIIAPPPADVPPIRAVCTDTRKMEPSSLFIALRGESFDGHAFLAQAAAGGAVAALVEETPKEEVPGLHILVVPNTRVAMGKLAKLVRQQFRAKVIAVAGSNGKTSTKHLIDSALRGKLRGTISPKSYNNDIGVPLTIFPADPLQDYVVLEMGTNHHGEIKVLTDMALPDIAVITNCGAEHLEGLDDLNGVRQENATIVEGLNPKGLLVVNGDDPALLQAVAEYSGRKLTFGFNKANDLFATDVECDDTGVRFRLNNRPTKVFVPLLGKHTAVNALAAIAVGRAMRMNEDDVLKNLAKATGPEMRLQLQEVRGVRVLNDAYNANPNSMKAALETISSLPAAGRRIAVVGDMRELGRSTEALHREVGEFIGTACKVDLLVCVGTESKHIADAAKSAGFPADRVRHYPDATAAAKDFPAQVCEGDLVLLKASRGIRLEAVAKAIADRPNKAGGVAA